MSLLARRLAGFALLLSGATLSYGVARASVADAPNGGADDEAPAATVSVYGATWCGACKQLEAALVERQIPFAVIDVDKNPTAYQWAKKASGGTNAIPLTSVARKTDVQWIIGSNIAAVEKAYKGQ